MPTTRPRHSITETDDVAAALRDAAERWPEDRDSPRKLLARLLAAGHETIRERRAAELAERRRRILEAAGSLTGVYPPGYLDELRADWPGMIVLDAGVVIALLDADDLFHGRAAELVLAVSSEPLRASAVTVAEILVRPVQLGRAADAERALDRLQLGVLGVASDEARRLAALRATTGLKLPDCCVLLAAEQVRAAAVLTFDERLARAARDAGYATTPPG